MTQSALEQEAVRKIAQWKIALTLHDRGVLLGFFLSLFPIFPVAFFGLILSLLNISLWKKGKLGSYDKNLAFKGAILGFINTLIGVFILFLIMHLVSGFDWRVNQILLFEKLSKYLEWLMNIRSSNKKISV